jgi:hypothetical protein
MWTSENRLKYNRDKLRYPGDLMYVLSTGCQWRYVPSIDPRGHHDWKYGITIQLHKGLFEENWPTLNIERVAFALRLV